MTRLFVIDASGYLYRSYFAIRGMTNPQGESTNSLYGFIRSYQKLLKDFEATHVVAVFDGPQNAASRLAIYPAYKAHRESMPPDLRPQIEWAKTFCQLAGIPHLSETGVEADDTMGSIAVWAAAHNIETYLCSSDKDLAQLVGGSIKLLNTFKENQILDSQGVEATYGVPPEKIIDFLSMMGDSSDNVPGVSGFGPKTVADLLKIHGSLDNLLANPDLLTGKKRDQLIAEREHALLSRQLVTLNTAVIVPQDLSQYALQAPTLPELKAFYHQMGFNSLLKELKNDDHQTLTFDYQLIDTSEALDELIQLLAQQKQIAIDVETTSIKPLQANLVGIGFGFQAGQAWYVPLNGPIPREHVMEKIAPLLENPHIGFFGHNLKYDYHVLKNLGISLRNICFDTIIASFLLNAHSRQHSLEILALELFGKVLTPISALIGKGKQEISMADVPLRQIADYCCEDVDYSIRLKQHFEPQIKERGLGDLFQNLELPLIQVLAAMEETGIFLDPNVLFVFGKELAISLEALSQAIYNLAGESFNLNSPKQLASILYEKLQIPPPKKIATGYSTDAEVLEKLSHQYPIAKILLEYRSLEKLRSTYVETLPHEIHPHTGRIHCTFNQTGAATGRLSCQDPNLQNIPVRTTEGLKIREAFRPEKPGWNYLAADYSQIELRLLAHLSEDPTLLDAFQNNRDIHTHTASLIFDLPVSLVTKEHRHSAKAVNFGIIYGQQAFGLSQELHISVKEADRFIRTYFERYPSVKAFLEKCKDSARVTGKAVTMTGRERLIPEINSRNAQIRQAAERLAVNTPFQGTAADLIKMAMLKIQNEWKGLAKMILQIHDELVFEVPDEEVERLSQQVRHTMQNVMQLKIPLVVDIVIGKNWKEC